MKRARAPAFSKGRENRDKQDQLRSNCPRVEGNPGMDVRGQLPGWLLRTGLLAQPTVPAIPHTVGVVDGKHMVSISAAVRKAIGLQGGDPIQVTLTVADTPQQVTIPADFAAALAADSKPASSSASSPTACSGITSTTSPPPRAPTPGNAASTKPLPCSAPANSGDDARSSALCQ